MDKKIGRPISRLRPLCRFLRWYLRRLNIGAFGCVPWRIMVSRRPLRGVGWL